ncbi:CoA ester lyase [Arthrobacter sp. zg-Y820]|uniref:HpcH/HpaI aldolase/citrate lyase family protein n=1 Tax=unclassified Arthrobacter TaxID=235627 RepID=UPI001E32DD13|nr:MULTISPECIES: CoA ester lyase [unclassified Arthrobacter]MCC9198144.1 CoA ester lyase [Arthrobacter sp. zg-Y820]MDK1281011.1 CoA ester lyase [Arthrobacter sp. zg.Y820]WIB11082.1 CoA ester lyase [Arthrobacter sp. zg-Y820]
MGPALLFCPADRPERFAKAADRADAVILDLEDAVAPADKDAARRNLVASDLDPATTIVRVNPVGTADFEQDLAAIRQTPYRTLMVAKAEDPSAIGAALADFAVVALVETALGVVRAPEIAQVPCVTALMWGAEDLMASLGGESSRFADGSYRGVAQHARAAVLLAGGAFGKGAIDSIYGNIPDTRGLEDEARDGAASGFAAKACIHPGQVAAVRAAYAPSADEVAYATDVIAEAANHGGVFSFRGEMIDGPLLKQARQTLSRAGR